ncbi:lipase 3-like [Amyelois transitella]|uniref:lipase 3-like n=1 Tax=Amyelois transitella TaxID=680683 RepID=UPI00067E1E94|nr:lipase 3-like [Amyelois transitella]
MKAVWLLFCLGLARGSIFRRPYQPHLESFGQQDSIESYRQEEPQVRQVTIVVDPNNSNDQSDLEQQFRYVNNEYYPNGKYIEKHTKKQKKQKKYKQQASDEDQTQLRYLNSEYYPIYRYADQKQNFFISKKVARPNQEYMPNDQDLKQFRLVKGEYYTIPRYGDSQSYSLMNQQDHKHTDAYGDAVQWRGIKIAVGPQSKVQKEDIESIYYEAQKAMKHPSEEVRQKYHEMYESVSEEDAQDANLNATQLLKKYQYPVEEHVVRTDDGYYLTMFRIVKETEKESKEVAERPVVLLMHSMLGSADDWLLMGPTHSLAYLLADQGYDVWLGNARGNRYSHHHVSRHPAQDDFWRYSNDEIALHDLPAMIDYALKTSNQKKLFYVGYDLGTTAYFALASTRPEYNDKVTKMYALSPMAYMSHVRSPLVKMIAPNSPFYQDLKQYLKDGEFNPSTELVYTMGGEMLEKEIGCKNIASNVYFVMSGLNVENMDVKTIRVIMGHLPSGASTRQVKQYGQAAAKTDFRMYDYGSEINQEVYGQPEPPVYDVTKIRSPVALYFSEHDWLAHPQDVLRLKEQLPNVTEYFQVPVDYFSHIDFLASQKATEVVYKKLIDSIKSNIHKN